jgi:hypothetical protein
MTCSQKTLLMDLTEAENEEFDRASFMASFQIKE